MSLPDPHGPDLISRGQQRIILWFAADKSHTQALLARQAGVSQQLISKIAHGKRVPKRYELVTALHTICGAEPGDWSKPPRKAPARQRRAA